eukprot:TRINITY_DN7182_c0_g1_i5.p1 TRINITY_DN7182_c0_g1~~TRINITY_DN7182_c0_g1_i5.p1  ORF type:complete len:514 (+),score=37.53 TRINITY_DN7182_c0_g1_i5:73-1614(+)
MSQGHFTGMGARDEITTTTNAVPTTQDGQTPSQLPSDERSPRRPSSSLVFLLVLLMVLLKLNVSQMLTTSHLIVTRISEANDKESDSNSTHASPDHPLIHMNRKDSPLGGVTSGVLIAAEPFGGVLGVLIASSSFLESPREAFIGACGIVFFGSIGCIFAIQQSSLPLLLVFRVFSGLAEGSLYIGQTYLAKLSSAETRTEIFGFWELGTAMGLLSGPAITSVLSTFFSDGEHVGESGLRLIALLAAWLGTCMMAALPSSQALVEAATSASDAAEISEMQHPWEFDRGMTPDKWIVAIVSTTSTVVRLMMRLLWEASAVLVLAAHFCLGHITAGYAATWVVCAYLLAQCLFVQVIRKTRISDHRIIQGCEVLELFGLMLMLRKPQDARVTEQEDVMESHSSYTNITFFLLGSSLFYAGNCLTSAPLSSWGTKRGPREACTLFYNHLCVQVGVCVGALLARLFSGLDPHQNTVVALLTPMVLAQACLSELGMSLDEGKQKKMLAATDNTGTPGC